MNLLAIAAGVPVLPALGRFWREEARAAARPDHHGLILLPTRRAARGLAAAFLAETAGGALLLPRILALGALDEAPLALAGALDLAPAVEETRRRAELARLVLARHRAEGEQTRMGAAWRLAGELAGLMDEAERAGVELRAALDRAAEPDHAMHWQRTLAFMSIVTEAWPGFLAGERLMNPVARQAALLHAQAEAWRRDPPGEPVLAVAAGGDMPAVVALLGAVAAAPCGTVVLPGLDLLMDEAAWEAVDEAHPQFGLRCLLSGLGATRGDVRTMPGTADPRPARTALLDMALLPARCLEAWRMTVPRAGTEGLALLDCADAAEEAAAIAMVLRDALEQPGAVAALVTPDRQLAARVSSELLRWGVLADDSAGETLADTPPAVLMRLLATAAAEALAPVPLLALLKHPLACLGQERAALRLAVRLLERRCLRGTAPPGGGMAGLRRAVLAATRHQPDDAPDRLALEALLGWLEAALDPLLARMDSAEQTPHDLVATLVGCAERVAAGPDGDGTVLWGHEEGEALATLLATTLEALPCLPGCPPRELPPLLDAMLEGQAVRSRRALRGRAGGEEHPRLFIWGLLEARLQQADVLVLGGLTEQVWPPATDPGPWLSRPMRKRAGLRAVDEAVGQAAQDFRLCACAAPRVVLSAARRRAEAPAVMSRLLVRLQALLGENGAEGGEQAGLAPHPAAQWAGMLDAPAGAARPVGRPVPSPPVGLRPRSFSVTELPKLERDAYAIYTQRILDLARLEPLERAAGALEYGNIVHRALAGFVGEHGTGWPDDAVELLTARLGAELRDAGLGAAQTAWWEGRLRRIAGWLDAHERGRRAGGAPLDVTTEQRGRWQREGPGGTIVISGRADRIERGAEGLVLLDYKTGTLPSPGQIEAFEQPQLLIEAAMAEDGAFGAALTGRVARAEYWRLAGDHAGGEPLVAYDGSMEQLEATRHWLDGLLARFDDPGQSYMPRPGGQYGQLAREAEWSGVIGPAGTEETPRGDAEREEGDA